MICKISVNGKNYIIQLDNILEFFFAFTNYSMMNDIYLITDV